MPKKKIKFWVVSCEDKAGGFICQSYRFKGWAESHQKSCLQNGWCYGDCEPKIHKCEVVRD